MASVRRFPGHGKDWQYSAGLDWRRWARIIEGITYCLVGASYTFGPPWWRTSGNLYYIYTLPIPFMVWSLLLFLGGILLLINLYPYNWVTYAFLLVASLFWRVTLAVRSWLRSSASWPPKASNMSGPASSLS